MKIPCILLIIFVSGRIMAQSNTESYPVDPDSKPQAGVPKGEILFILGTSGTGKSVLLKNLVGLLRSDGGEIWIDGEEVSGFTEDEFLRIRRAFAFRKQVVRRGRNNDDRCPTWSSSTVR